MHIADQYIRNLTLVVVTDSSERETFIRFRCSHATYSLSSFVCNSGYVKAIGKFRRRLYEPLHRLPLWPELSEAREADYEVIK